MKISTEVRLSIARAMPDGLEDAERDADAVGEERRHEAVVDRDRQPVGDDLRHRLVVAERHAEIEPERIEEPGSVGDEERPVEAVELAEPGELLFGNVQLNTGGRAAAPGHLSAAARARESHAKLIDLSTWDELAKQEGGEGDADERRDHQQQPANHVVAQRLAARLHRWFTCMCPSMRDYNHGRTESSGPGPMVTAGLKPGRSVHRPLRTSEWRGRPLGRPNTAGLKTGRSVRRPFRI